ncbi:hypothetical protein AQJ30_16435 [Streptomyces longwoodensis]|uniref:Uncharacterized protein n=1 Tax=Streptomyces longwoodensis TaxID=68231 RepID=A0A117QNB1_9ACTN|nr:hypothetical protein AQJ30_16435 [Streptomyces longwoodensis]
MARRRPHRHRRQGPERGTGGCPATSYAAEELLELDDEELDDDPEELDESDDEDDVDVEGDDEDDVDFEDAGALLDEEPRLSLR